MNFHLSQKASFKNKYDFNKSKAKFLVHPKIVSDDSSNFVITSSELLPR